MNRKYIAILFPLLLFLLVVILQRFEGGVNPEKIIMIAKSADPEFEFWQTIKQGAEIAAEEAGVSFQFRGPLEEQDVEGQKAIIQKTIIEKPDILIIAASDENEFIDLIDEAVRLGIKVFTIDSDIKSNTPISFVATDNEEAAKVLGNYTAKTMGRQGEVAIVNFVEGTSAARERERGLLSAFENYPDIVVHPTKYTVGTNVDAHVVAKNFLAYQYPNVSCVVGCNQKTLEGVIRAVEELGLEEDIVVVGFDSSLEIIHAIEKNIVDAVVIQKPFNMGYMSIINAINEYKGKQVPKKINISHKLITKETLSLLENQKLLYPITK